MAAAITYHYHGQEDETRSCRLSRPALRVDEGIDRRGGQHHAPGEVARDGDMVGVYGVAGDDDEDAQDEEQAVDDGPPGEGRKSVKFGGLNLRDYARYEGDEPCELWGHESAGLKGADCDRVMQWRG